MTALFAIFMSVDVFVYQTLNALAGNRVVDWLASFEENCSVLKGGLFLGMYWYFWFRVDPDQNRRRRAIIVALVGALLALITARIVADIAPYRVRPMYDYRLPQHPYAFPINSNMVNWSSFPSDTATFFFALGAGLAYLYRPLTMPLLAYIVIWVCLPRMFLGIHYLSDMLVGAVIGISLVLASLNRRWLQSQPVTVAIALSDSKPEMFYVVAFVVSFEMSVLFQTTFESQHEPHSMSLRHGLRTTTLKVRQLRFCVF